MSTRPLFPVEKIWPSALGKLEAFHPDVVREVSEAVARHDVVVVGMAQNPFVKKVRAALSEASIPFTYLEYGSYLSQWQRRLAIKLWSGWPTFPQVFVKGQLIGGEELTKAAIADGSLRKALSNGQG
jgi:glutaredoxin-related protein